MSAAISNLPGQPCAGSAAFIGASAIDGLRRVGPCPIAIICLTALLLWGFFGSLALGLGTPAASDPATVRLWLTGAVAVVLLGLVAGFAAGSARDG